MDKTHGPIQVEIVGTHSLPAALASVVIGPPGPPGPIGDAGGALLVTNRLSELAADPTAQADAQSNLGLGAVDPLAYYILAKA